jgi:beta-glucosidase/6-phospho-beta-glucosidase/beta-galactosidase
LEIINTIFTNKVCACHDVNYVALWHNHAASSHCSFLHARDILKVNYWLMIDIARIAAMGVPYYSFSISWSRVFPFGKGPVNELALQHYDDLIDTCLQYGVKPVVTLFHWDLPLFLANSYGGWLSEEIVADYTAYAEVVFKGYGNKVSHWFTMNEPIVFCEGLPVKSLNSSMSPETDFS